MAASLFKYLLYKNYIFQLKTILKKTPFLCHYVPFQNNTSKFNLDNDCNKDLKL